MDLVVEKLSNLESIWRITSLEIVDLIKNNNLEYEEEEEEFDIFKFKPRETQVHMAILHF
jgi:DNA-dependent RNA polymerase auxiliary subunit epsilon